MRLGMDQRPLFKKKKKKSFYNKTLSQSRLIFQFIFESRHIWLFWKLEMWENTNTKTTCSEHFAPQVTVDTDDRLWKWEQSASQLQHAIKAASRQPRTTKSLDDSLHNPASVLKQPFGFFYHSCRQLWTLYGHHWSRRCYCFVLSSFVCFMVPF